METARASARRQTTGTLGPIARQPTRRGAAGLASGLPGGSPPTISPLSRVSSAQLLPPRSSLFPVDPLRQASSHAHSTGRRAALQPTGSPYR